ncbi:MAG: hypothetical protein UT66_C0056G0003 [candidate division CPR2 bacterium GW2011_GWC1_39_9]|uniref:Baseplate protein J-like domain-containing protein n=1 Tax=candidate division CPR2 bacterium GW2011_GWC2_39_10 TaxID=1618345 RepID=A0A0G0P5H5_UNCC2|nr:MAG: hypothetical protein UT18_C0021G0003 [candidate division CPR2 bacterium GW2011_GWC2_39_10]KKR32729.1 MAG: hypothetical protein UT66_C0056G0003 [candidate division CPR2 bacterium GW2011_GWC1_39_9]
MKRVIYLEVDEEITSAIDKVKKVDEHAIFLVIPKGATLLQSVINLRLLNKEADKIGKRISIVTSDKVGKAMAARVGLPVFTNIDKNGIPQGLVAEIEKEESAVKNDKEEEFEEDAGPLIHTKVKDYKAKNEIKKAYISEDSEADDLKEDEELSEVPTLVTREIRNKSEDIQGSGEGQKRPEKVHIASRRFIWAIFLAIPVILFILGFIFLPKAEVIIAVASEKMPVDAKFAVDKDAQGVDAKQGMIPGKFIDDIKEEQKEFDATGKKDVGAKATGMVTLYNKWDSDAFTLKKGTQMRSGSGKVFLLVSEVSIPGTTINHGTIVAGQISAAVEAELSGDSYNIGASDFVIVKLSAPEQVLVYGKSLSNMSGGSTKEVKIVSDADVAKSKETFIKEVSDNFIKKLKADNKSYIVIDKAVKTEAVSFEASPAVGAEASKFTLKLKSRYRAVIFDDADINRYFTKILEAQVPEGKQVYMSEIDSSKFALLSEFKDKLNSAEFRFSANVDLTPKLDLEKIKMSLVLKKKSDIEKSLKEYASVKSVKFKSTPFSMSIMPLLPSHIAVKMEVIK